MTADSPSGSTATFVSSFLLFIVHLNAKRCLKAPSEQYSTVPCLLNPLAYARDLASDTRKFAVSNRKHTNSAAFVEWPTDARESPPLHRKTLPFLPLLSEPDASCVS